MSSDSTLRASRPRLRKAIVRHCNSGVCRRHHCLLFLLPAFLLIIGPARLPAQDSGTFTVEAPKILLAGIDFSIKVSPGMNDYLQAQGAPLRCQIIDGGSGTLLADSLLRLDPQQPQAIQISGMQVARTGKIPIEVRLGEVTQNLEIRSEPAWLSLLPPLLAILLALITRQVIVALFCGIWLGVTFLYDYNPIWGFLHTLDEYIIRALANPDHVFILVFSLALGGMVGVITRSGGTQGIVEKLAQYARNARGGQVATWLMGVLIFFDDYANTLIVGNTMRPLSDKLRISREKLSYLVDSTAAPVCNIAIISTWIGYEISLIGQSLEAMNMNDNPYLIFIQTIPYNYYPIYTLVFGLMVALMLRDFGPMYAAEHRTRTSGEVLGPKAAPLANMTSVEIMADEKTPKRWYNALVPVLVVVAVVCGGLVYTGWGPGMATLEKEAAASGMGIADLSLLRQISAVIGAANSFAVLMWASFTGGLVAILMALGQRLLSLSEAMDAWVGGIRSMIMAAIILTAAWAIGQICNDVFTADYVIHLTKSFLTPHWLPLLIFLSAGIISFATGTSWGTMAILMPISIPLAHKFPLTDPSIDAAHAMGLLLSTTAAVLAGATFGDHCSPISDTTIMSSMASSADHIDHVRTQLPYAMAAGLIACLFGYLPIGFGVSTYVALPLGIAATYLLIRFVGKRAGEE